MAILPKRFQRGKGSIEVRVEALEKYIDYLHEQLEHYALSTGKEIDAIKKQTNVEK